jgi:hypothetical protein
VVDNGDFRNLGTPKPNFETPRGIVFIIFFNAKTTRRYRVETYFCKFSPRDMKFCEQCKTHKISIAVLKFQNVETHYRYQIVISMF